MKNLFIIIFLSSLISTATSQEMKKGIVYPIDIKKYIKSDKVIWYGWDLSVFKVCDKNIFSYHLKEEYIPSWLTRLNKEISLNEVRRAIDKIEFVSDLQSIQDLYKEKKFDEFLTNDFYTLPIDSIKSLVKKYKLPQNEGIGLTIIVEFMDRLDRYVTGYVTFFDIKSREVVWATKMKGLPGGKSGPIEYYGNGIVELYVYFFGDYYKQTLRKSNVVK